MKKPPPSGQRYLPALSRKPRISAATKAPLEARHAADRDHDQEQHEVLAREGRRQADDVDREPAAERRHGAAEREGRHEQPVDVDPDRLGHAPVVDRGPDLGAEQRALEHEPKQRHEGEPDPDQHHPVGGKSPKAEIDLALQLAR